MHFAGVVFDDPDEKGRVSDAIVRKDRVALIWEQDGETWHFSATPDDNGVFKGNYGAPRPDLDCELELQVFEARSGDVMLAGALRNRRNGNGSTIIFRLKPAGK